MTDDVFTKAIELGIIKAVPISGPRQTECMYQGGIAGQYLCRKPVFACPYPYARWGSALCQYHLRRQARGLLRT